MTTLLTRLALSNWRNFKEIEVALGHRAFVVGPNASGKSNLLDAFRFLRDIARPGGSLAQAVADRRGLKHVRSLHAGNDSRVVIEVDVTVGTEPWRYELEFSGGTGKSGGVQVGREFVWRGETEVLRRLGRQEPNPLLRTQTHLEQISQSLPFRPLADALAAIADVHVVPQVARTALRAEELSKHDAPGSDFIDQLARLTERQQKAALRRLGKLLRVAVPRFSELHVVRDSEGRPHLEARYEHWRRRGGWQNEKEFSDGTLRLIGLLWAIDNGTAPLLLEEPELSLHRGVIKQLPRIFARARLQTGRQVIVTTHAEEMLADRGVDPSEVIVLTPSEHETSVRNGNDVPELRRAVKAKLPLGRAVTSLTVPKGVEQLSIAFAAEPQE